MTLYYQGFCSHARMFLTAALCCGALLLTGCGGEKKSSPKSATKAVSETTSTTTADGVSTTTANDAGSANNISAGQLEFFTERYISTEERLLRRQQRIEGQLQGDAASATPASQS